MEWKYEVGHRFVGEIDTIGNDVDVVVEARGFALWLLRWRDCGGGVVFADRLLWAVGYQFGGPAGPGGP